MSVRPIHAVALITLALVAALPAVAEASFPTNADRALLDWITSHATTKIDGVVYSQVETDDMSSHVPHAPNQQVPNIARIERGVLVKPMEAASAASAATTATGESRKSAGENVVDEQSALRNASLAVSLKTCLCLANLEYGDKRLADFLRPLFYSSEEFGLAMLLLHEVHRGEQSPYAPLLDATFFPPDKLPPSIFAVHFDVNATAALKETFASSQLSRMFNSLYQRFVHLARKLILDRFESFFPPTQYYDDRLKWGLAWTRHAMTRVHVPDESNGAGKSRSFLAICPLLHLLPHHPRGATLRLVSASTLSSSSSSSSSSFIGQPRSDPEHADEVIFVPFHNTRVGLEPVVRRDSLLPDAEILGRYGVAPIDDDLDDLIEHEQLKQLNAAAESKEAPPNPRAGDSRTLVERGFMHHAMIQLALAHRIGEEELEEELEEMEMAHADVDLQSRSMKRVEAVRKCRFSDDPSLGEIGRVVDAVTMAGPSPQLLCALRVACANFTELVAIAEEEFDPNQPIDPLMEYNAMMLFEVSMERQLEAYAQSDADDIRLLARLANETAYVEAQEACLSSSASDGGDAASAATCSPHRPSAFWISALRVSAREKELMITALHAGRQRVELVLPSISYQSGREPEASRTMSSTKGFAFESRSTAEKKKKKKKRSSKQKDEL